MDGMEWIIRRIHASDWRASNRWLDMKTAAEYTQAQFVFMMYEILELRRNFPIERNNFWLGLAECSYNSERARFRR